MAKKKELLFEIQVEKKWQTIEGVFKGGKTYEWSPFKIKILKPIAVMATPSWILEETIKQVEVLYGTTFTSITITKR